MRKWMASFACVLALVTGAGSAWAGVLVREVGWQLAVDVNDPKTPYHDVSQWLFPPTPTLKVRPRLLVRLANEGTRPETAVLLRYSISARLKKMGDPGAGVWVVPFIVDEKHIPRVVAGATQAVPVKVNRVALNSYLKKAYRSGFWPDALRATVMVEPRAGDSLAGHIGEKILPLQWKPGEAVKTAE